MIIHTKSFGTDSFIGINNKPRTIFSQIEDNKIQIYSGDKNQNQQTSPETYLFTNFRFNKMQIYSGDKICNL